MMMILKNYPLYQEKKEMEIKVIEVKIIIKMIIKIIRDSN